MNREQLQEELSLQLLRTSLRGKFEISQAVESYNLTFMQAAVLCLIDPGKSLPMNALSGFLGCAPSYITGIIEQLVTGSFITREEWPEDRRVKAITLTTQGVTLRAKMLKIAIDARLPNVSTLSTSELHSTIQTLDKATSDMHTDLWPALKSHESSEELNMVITQAK